jgi:hypothetical protein
VRGLATLALLAWVAAASAGAGDARLAFGKRTLVVPAPSGFDPLSGSAPHVVKAMEAYLPTGTRLVEAYAEPADAAVLARGEGRELARYYQLQVMRKLEGTVLSERDFAESADEIERQLVQAFGQPEDMATALSNQGNARMKREHGVDPHLKIGGVQYLGSPRREPWAFFFTLRATVSGEGIASIPQIGAGALALVDHQLLYLYAYAREDDAAARAWAEEAVAAWGGRLRAANPSDAALEAEAEPWRRSPWAGVGRYALVGAVGGGLAGLIVFLLRRRRPR